MSRGLHVEEGSSTYLSCRRHWERFHARRHGARDHHRVVPGHPWHRGPGHPGYGNGRESVRDRDHGGRYPGLDGRHHGHGDRYPGHGDRSHAPHIDHHVAGSSRHHGCGEAMESGHDEEEYGHGDARDQNHEQGREQGHGQNRTATRQRAEYAPTGENVSYDSVVDKVLKLTSIFSRSSRPMRLLCIS